MTVSEGDVPAWAHPVITGAAEAISDPLDLELLLPPLVAAGPQGIECYYSGYPPEVTRATGWCPPAAATTVVQGAGASSWAKSTSSSRSSTSSRRSPESEETRS